MPGTSSTIEACTRCGRRNRVPAAARGTPRCAQCHAPLPWQATAADDDFPAVAESSPVPVLVDLWAPWCGPCRTLSPALEQVARELAGMVKLVKVNVDEAPALTRRFAVQAVPTLIMMRGGDVVARQIGAPPLPTLRSWVQETLSTKP